MESIQNLTISEPKTDLQVAREETEVKANQQRWIDFQAVGGLMTEADGTLKPMTVTAFAELIGVHRQTLYDWRNSIPDFWDRVKLRRSQIGTQSRLDKVHTGLYLKAATGDPQAVKLYLQIFDNWQPPSQKHEVELSTGLADLVAKKKLEQEHQKNVIDITPNATTDTSTAS